MAQIEYRVEDGIAYITLNRPEKLNALTDDMIVELRDLWRRYDDDPDVMVGIISGNGRSFCSGADVRQRQNRTREELLRLGSPQGRESRLETLPYQFMLNYKPIIAAVHGHVMGAGLYLSMVADQIVASTDARFQITETHIGWAATNFTAMLAHRTGGGFSYNVSLTGRYWSAEEGLAVGAVDRLAPAGKHLDVAREMAKELMALPPLAVRAIVEYRRGVLEEVETAARLRQNKRLHLTEDYAERAKAFVEKRKPVFKGR